MSGLGHGGVLGGGAVGRRRGLAARMGGGGSGEVGEVEVGEHFAVLLVVEVEFEGFGEVVADVAGGGALEVGLEVVAVGGVGAVVDDGLSALRRGRGRGGRRCPGR